MHVTDLGLLRSYAAFDYVRTYNGRPFRLGDHLTRFRNSARELRLPLDYSDGQITEIIKELLAKSGLPEAALRLVITGGNSRDGMTIATPNFFIIVEELPRYAPECWTHGVRLITNDYARDEPAVKSTGYLHAIKRMPLVRQQDAHDMLYCHGGHVLELTRENFFLFHGDTLVTPKENVLLGITRMVVLELCQGAFAVEERAVPTTELSKATEAFLSGTTKGVMPVVQVDDIVIGKGRVGENTRKTMRLFQNYAASN